MIKYQVYFCLLTSNQIIKFIGRKNNLKWRSFLDKHRATKLDCLISFGTNFIYLLSSEPFPYQSVSKKRNKSTTIPVKFIHPIHCKLHKVSCCDTLTPNTRDTRDTRDRHRWKEDVLSHFLHINPSSTLCTTHVRFPLAWSMQGIL